MPTRGKYFLILLSYIVTCFACFVVYGSIPCDINKDNTIDLKDLTLLSNYWLNDVEPICNFMAIADLHYGDFEIYTGLNNVRVPNAHDRFYSFAAETNKKDPDFVIQLGDIVDQSSVDYLEGVRDYVRDVNSLSDHLIYYVIGNHFNQNVNPGFNTINEEFFGLMLQTCPNNIENIWSFRGDYPWAYTFDIGDKFRGVNFYRPYALWGSDVMPVWWVNEVTDVNMPVIIFTHDRMSDEMLDVVSNIPNVVATFKGHDHDGTYEVYNGLPIFGLRGSVMGEDENDYTSNAYYLVEVGWLKNGNSKRVYIKGKGFVRGEDFFFVSNKEFNE